MSIHASRPLPPGKTSHPVVVDPPRTPAPTASPPPAAAAENPEAPPGVVAAPPSRAAGEPKPTASPRSAGASELSAGPWYRQEPWLAAMALAVVFVAAAIAAPRAAKYPLIGLGGVCMVVGLVLLMRRGAPPPAGM